MIDLKRIWMAMARDALWRGQIRDALRYALLAWQCNAVLEEYELTTLEEYDA